METANENVAHYLYTLKIIHDLNLYNRPTLNEPYNLQKQIFNTSYSIETNYPNDKHILEKWVDDRPKPYEIALNEIDFSETAKEKVIEFIRKQLKVVIKYGNNESPNLIVQSFSTIWKGVRREYEGLNHPSKERFTVCRNEPMKLESCSEFILQVGIYDAYVIDADGNRTSIHKGGNSLNCQNIRPGDGRLTHQDGI